MGDTIQIDVAKLTSAITKLTTLVDSIDSRRRTAATVSPIGLPSLSDTQLGLKVTRLRDRLPELQTRLDLAKLLDEKGTGQVTYQVPGADGLVETKLLIGTHLASSLAAVKVDDPASRLRAAELAALLAKYGKDTTVANRLMQALGPGGLTKVMRTLRSVTTAQPPYWVGVKDQATEKAAVLALQDQMAGSLALLLSTASKSLGRDWGRDFARDSWAAGVLLRYADKQNLSFSKEFFRGVGHTFKERENGDPLAWDAASRDPDNNSFGTESLADSNPMREYLNTADNSAETSQAVMGDEGLREYFLRDRRYLQDDPLLDQAGKVLDRATIGAARSLNDDEARTAADISSHVLSMTNDKVKPHPGFTDEVGGIMATYIMDIDRALVGDGSDDMTTGPGSTAIGEYRMGLDAEDGLPRFGIKLDEDTAKNAIGYIREDETAVRKFGQSVALYNQTRMDWGAEHHKNDTPGDAFHQTVRESAQLTSLVTAELIEGDLDDANKRIRTMELLTAPLDNVNPAAPVGELINDGIIGAGREAAGDRLLQQELQKANEKDGNAASFVKLQAVYAANRAMPDNPDVPDWPTANGQLKPPGELTDAEIRELLRAIGNRGGVTGTAASGIEDAWKTVDERYPQ